MKNSKPLKAFTAVAVAGLIPLSLMGNSWTSERNTITNTLYVPTATHTFAVDEDYADYYHYSTGPQTGADFVDYITAIISANQTDGELYSGYMYSYVNYGNLQEYNVDGFGTIYEYTIRNSWLPVFVLMGLWQSDVNIDSIGTFDIYTNVNLRAGNETKIIHEYELWDITERTYIHNRSDEDLFLQELSPYIQHIPSSTDYVYIDSFTYRIGVAPDTIRAETVLDCLYYPTEDNGLTYTQYCSDIQYLMENYTDVTIEQVAPSMPTDLLFAPIESFLALELFPGFTVETLFIIAVAIGVFGVFLKFYAGG